LLPPDEILTLKCTKIDFGWGSAPDPAEGAYYSEGGLPTSKGRGGWDGMWVGAREGREGRREGGEGWRGREGGKGWSPPL